MGNPLTDLVQAGLSGGELSDDLKNQVDALAQHVLTDALNNYEFSDDSTKAMLTKTLLPSVIRSLGADDEESALRKAREEFTDILAQCVGVGSDDDDIDPDEEYIEAIADAHDDYEEAGENG